ncbi:MAG: hypothetical protein ACOY3U_08115 [Bacillota bacterium]
MFPAGQFTPRQQGQDQQPVQDGKFHQMQAFLDQRIIKAEVYDGMPGLA